MQEMKQTDISTQNIVIKVTIPAGFHLKAREA